MATQPVLRTGSFRFGDDFELDLRAYELRSAGVPLKLKPIPMELLLLLVERRGELVTREHIVEHIWGKGVFLDTDNSINGAISKIRQVLRDDAAQPRFVQTVTGRGYRFTAPVTETQPQPQAVTPPAEAHDSLIGKRVSHYRILQLLGGGGMGVVYKAEDLKLGRRVALKFLPPELASDPKALARLESEARAASALDHRNICSIYELDEHEGQPFIVMQLLEGQTLQEQMEAAAQHGATLPLAKVLAIAMQVAEGLQAAHEKGFLHRDIKPANIFITTQSEAKILDFGLAQSLERDVEDIGDESIPRDAAPSEHNPIAAHRLRLTMTGAHMGTAYYMSPEQVRGEKLDARTDIFSFGLVLYQMLSGQRAFPGNTLGVVHDGILHNTPVPLSELSPQLPAKLIVIVDKCLEKDREHRFQSAGELRAAFEDMRETDSLAAPSSKKKSRMTFAGVAIFLLAATSVWYWWRHLPLSQRAFQKYRTTALTFTGTVAFAAVSPDGRYVAYADEAGPHQSLWLQQVATSIPVRILGPVSHTLVEGLRFTPDGNYLYFLQDDADSESQDLYRIATLGGSPQKMVSNLDDYSFVDVSPDGTQILYTRRETSKSLYHLLLANGDGDGERDLLTLKGTIIGMPVWSPDGQTVAFGIGEGGGSITGIAVIPSKGGAIRRIMRGARFISGFAWLPDQSGLLVSMWPFGGNNYSLWALSYPDGKLRQVTTDLASYFRVSLVQGGGKLATVQTDVNCTLWVAPADNPSDVVPLHEGAARMDGLWGVSWLPDGRLVFGIGDLSELWVVNRDGSNRQQLTHVGKTATNPSTTAGGGGIIVFQRHEPSAKYGDIWAVDSQGNNLRQLTSGPSTKFRPEISPDGKWIVYSTGRGPLKMSLAGGPPTLLEQRGGMDPTISPDGRWIAFDAVDDHIVLVDASGKTPNRYLPFIDEPQAPSPISTFPVSYPVRWNATSDAITFVRTRNGVSNIWSQPIDGGPPRQLTYFNSMVIWSHSWSPDGKYLVMARGNLSRDAVLLSDTGK